MIVIKRSALLLTAALFCPLPALYAGKVEADFNDMYLGDTRTSGYDASPNSGNLNTGRGFATGGPGNYDNGTGVVQFQAGDLTAPNGVSNFISNQKKPVDAAAAGLGVVFTSGNNADNFKYTRFQERQFAAPLLGSEIWFSFLFKLTGPDSQGQVFFNAPSTTGSNEVAEFGISLGHATRPGAIAINLDATQTPGSLPDGDPLLYYDGTKGVEVVDAANVTAHLIIGRVSNNTSGDDTIEIWLNPPDALNPTATPPTLIATADELADNGIFSVGFKGTRFPAAVNNSGTYVNGGHFAVDHFRISDDADALAFVTGHVPDDPKLEITSTENSLNFRGVYGTGSPVSASPRTITLTNTGVSESITVNSINFLQSTSVFTVTTDQTLPVTLAPNETISFTVGASSANFGYNQSATLQVATSVPEQNMLFTANAAFFTSGTRLTQNPTFDVNDSGWVSDHSTQQTPPVRVAPGAIGSTAMTRLRGSKDPWGGAPDNLSQTIYNGAADWEMTFYMSPRDVSTFSQYTPEGNPASGNDKSFQLIIQSNNAIPTPASGTEGAFTNAVNGDRAMINLAYLPGEDQGFCVFNGSNWEPIGLPLIQGSIDINNDGNLRVTDGDTVAMYLIRIKGTGFGTSAAKYSISLSNPNTVTTAATVNDLTIWSSAPGELNTPGAITFTTGDISRSGGSITTSYWIDEVSLYATEAPASDFSVSPTGTIVSHNNSVATEMIAVTNSGFSHDVVITGAEFNSTVVSSNKVFPITIPPGTSQYIPVSVGTGFMEGNNAGRPTITVRSDSPVSTSRTATFLAIGTADNNLLGNWNFQTSGMNAGDDSDSWASWHEEGNIAASKDVAGLISNSGKAAWIGRGAVVRNEFGAIVPDFSIEFPFAVQTSTEDVRMFNFALLAANGSNVNIRLRNGVWEAFHDANSTSSGWNTIIATNPVLDSVDANLDNDIADEADTKNVYKIRITGKGWDTATPTYQLEILDTSDVVLEASAPDLAFYQYSFPNRGGLGIKFQATQENCPGFWVDDVLARSTVITTTPEIKVTSITGGPGAFTINWDSQGSSVILERSTTLLADSWEIISSNDADGTHTDTQAPSGRAFYRIRPVGTP
jgi:hypothetical protein